MMQSIRLGGSHRRRGSLRSSLASSRRVSRLVGKQVVLLRSVWFFSLLYGEILLFYSEAGACGWPAAPSVRPFQCHLLQGLLV